GTIVYTWATVGCCAQIRKKVHLSGGLGIGGLMEPLHAKPTINENNFFIAAPYELVEWLIVEECSVISKRDFYNKNIRAHETKIAIWFGGFCLNKAGGGGG
ncbi:hypothetical protein ACVGXX_22460, partial [Enterobacter intestinihominis]